MDLKQLQRSLQIRYIKLHFGLCMVEDTCLPVNKVSAIRGGIGEMLLRSNCIRDRNCPGCDFKGECIVRRIMYSQFEEKPAFVTTGESAGYVFECENYQKEFRGGDILEFQLLLFGKTIVYFSQFVQALYQLGNVGIGREYSCFEIAYIRNTLGRDIPVERVVIHCSEYLDEIAGGGSLKSGVISEADEEIGGPDGGLSLETEEVLEDGDGAGTDTDEAGEATSEVIALEKNLVGSATRTSILSEKTEGQEVGAKAVFPENGKNPEIHKYKKAKSNR